MKFTVSLAAFMLCCATVHAQSAIRPAAALLSSNLPIVVIDTHGKSIVDEPKISADMGIIYNGEGLRNSMTDPFNEYNGKIAIEIRGSSSQMFPKKQYGFTTTTETGDDNDVSLLGFPAEHTWILSAPYTDKTFMRDALTYILVSSLGRYASRTKFCEVFVNEGYGLDYKGVYILMEKIKRGKNRVNISKMTPADTTGDNLTGGYIYKIDKADKPTDRGWDALYPPFATSARRYLMYQYHYPDPEEIMPQQMAYLQAFEKNFETVMASSAYTDAATGYPHLLDVPSFVDMVVMNELSKNVDGYRLSTYLYKDRTSKNEKLYAGPLWDYNLGYGNCNYDNAYIRSGWQLDNLASDSRYDSFAGPFWWKRLWADPLFKRSVADRWRVLRAGRLSTPTIIAVIDSLAQVVTEAQQRNYERWPIIGTYVWPNYYYLASSYEDEVSWMKGWIVNRILWMDMTLAPLETAVHEPAAAAPTTMHVMQNYPNPFNPSTTIGYTTTSSGRVRIEIFDVLGRRAATLVDEVQAPGAHTIQWNAEGMTSGVYYCRMNAGSGTAAIRMSVAK